MYSTLIFLAAIAVSSSQILQQFTQNPCATKPTCHDCIATPSCAWCYDEKINTTKRCFQVSYPIPPLDQCDVLKIYNPPTNKFKYISNAALSHRRGAAGGGGGSIVEGGEITIEQNSSSSASGSSQQSGGGSGSKKESIVQIRPQKVALELRAKQTYSINMFYTQAEDYPVDLYYLMDLSKSMEDDKEKLSALGDHLAATMKKITKKFTLGFGSFVDKVVMPYVSTIPEKLRHPCTKCEPPYGFRNHMTLSTNTNTFSQMVKNASVSGNLDAPEGGFDAIMQAVVCRKQIGWREQARRLLVFSTDAGFHYAGDGKLGGIVKPNDGKCHLDSDGYYEMSSLQDYPSISQINMYVKKHAINVIFAVTAEKLDIYKQLQQHVEGSSCGKLSDDSSNVVDLIIEQYQAISSTIEMKHDASSAINVKFFSKCLNPLGELVETNKCDNLKVGSLIEFKIQLEIIECPKDPKEWKQLITIKPIGSDESLTIDLTMLCDCPCERPGHALYKENAVECHNKGTLMCGICSCESDAHGAFCECGKNHTASADTNANCKNKDTGLECSGRGTCLCGTCLCLPRTEPEEEIYGPTCECDNFSCERHNGLICSGPDHGKCKCGNCECEDGWMGDNCACRNTTDSCIMPGEKDATKVCSGNGICECGVCKCNVTEEGRYYGRFCEHCPNCSDDCNKYKECVQCQQYETGRLAPKDSKECQACTFTPTEAETIVVDDKKGEVLCAFYDDDDCRYSFVYSYDESKNITIRAQKERECPAEVFLLGIVLGVIAVVVLLGLAILLLWKLFTTIHDRREFAKFEKEAMMARWDTGENPIYKQATSTFKNPTYAGKS